MRRGLKVAVGLIALYVLLSAALLGIMYLPPSQFGKIVAHLPAPAMILFPFQRLWFIARGGSLHEGSQAPEFELPKLDRSEQVKLTALRGRPVVLIFGSYT